MFSVRTRFSFFLSFFLFLSALQADVLVLVNGDRLEGSLVTKGEDSLEWNSTLFGELTVELGKVLEIIEESSGEPDNAGSSLASVTPPPGETLSRAPVQDDVAPESSSALLKALDWVNPFKGWSSKLNLGYTWNGGETSNQEFLILFSAQQKLENSDLRFKFRWDYGNRKVGDGARIKTSDKFRTDFRYRRDISDHFFAQAEAKYFKDTILEIDHQFDQNLGLGVRFWRTKRSDFTLSASYTARYREVRGFSDGWENLLTFEEEFRFMLYENVTFFQEASASFEPKDTEEADYAFTLRLENRLTERLSLDLRYDYEFTYVVGFGVDRKTQKFIASLGYLF